MTVQEITTAISHGKTVHWISDRFTVVSDDLGYFIKAEGLTFEAPLTVENGELNGKPEDFFIDERTLYKFSGYNDKYEYLYSIDRFKVYRIFPDTESNTRMLVISNNEVDSPWMEEESQIHCEIAIFEDLIEHGKIEYCEVAMDYIDRLSTVEEKLK